MHSTNQKVAWQQLKACKHGEDDLNKGIEVTSNVVNMVAGVKRASLSISETTDPMGFSQLNQLYRD